MARSPRRRIRSLFFNIAVALAAGCISGEPVMYSPEDDDEAMATIASSWAVSSPTISLSLCEDVTAELGENSCQIKHQVRGGGRGTRHEFPGGGGCGGCALATIAAVTGTLSAPGLQGPVAVAGQVRLQSAYHSPYEFPYHIELHCTAGTPCSVSGTLNEDGSIEIGVSTAPDLGPVELARSGAAACP